MENPDIRTAVDGLIKATLDAGAPDNVTAVIVEACADVSSQRYPSVLGTSPIAGGVGSALDFRPETGKMRLLPPARAGPKSVWQPSAGRALSRSWRVARAMHPRWRSLAGPRTGDAIEGTRYECRWESKELLQPISADPPCGENLEDTRCSRPSTRSGCTAEPSRSKPRPSGEGARRRSKIVTSVPRSGRRSGTGRSRRCRRARIFGCSSHLGTAMLRTDGLPAFVETHQRRGPLAGQLLGSDLSRWSTETAIVRRSALNCFADPIAVIDALRRAPIVSSRQHGTFSLRDIDIATGQARRRRGRTAAGRSADQRRVCGTVAARGPHRASARACQARWAR